MFVFGECWSLERLLVVECSIVCCPENIVGCMPFSCNINTTILKESLIQIEQLCDLIDRRL